MLTYQPQNDIYNGIFRILSILTYDTNKSYCTELLRILDFYYIFPNFINDIIFPLDLKPYKEKFKDYNKNSYFLRGNKKQIFYTLSQKQDDCFTILTAKKIIDYEAFKQGIIKLDKDVDIAPHLYQQLENKNEENKDILDFLTEKLTQIDFTGEKGLKARTGLMEYRYDFK